MHRPSEGLAEGFILLHHLQRNRKSEESLAAVRMSSAGIIQQPFKAPVTEDPSFIHFFEAWKQGKTFHVEEIGGDEIVSHYQYMLRLPVVGEMLKQFIAGGGSLPSFQIFHLAFLKIYCLSSLPPSEKIDMHFKW